MHAHKKNTKKFKNYCLVKKCDAAENCFTQIFFDLFITGDHQFSTYTKFSEKLTSLIPLISKFAKVNICDHMVIFSIFVN